jgi:hypothetical protein
MGSDEGIAWRRKPIGRGKIMSRSERFAMTDANVNPYASPMASLVPEPLASEDAWRDGNVLVVRKGGILPDRCIKCNAPAAGIRNGRTLYWHSPWLYLLLFAGLLPFLIVAAIVQHKIQLQVGLCRRHRSRRRWMMACGALSVVGGIALMIEIAGRPRLAVDLSRFGIIGGFLMIFAGAACAYYADRLVTPRRIDEQFAWIRGACREYLAELPEFSQQWTTPYR